MLMLNRKNHCKGTLGTAIVVIAAAHIAAGILLCKGTCQPTSSLQKMAKRAKRTVMGLIREFV
ncbi:MAG: hypothetical protein J6B54_05830 [Clostridia bacterium]|nr:hypothetical protein [Clostridia bacterium]